MSSVLSLRKMWSKKIAISSHDYLNMLDKSRFRSKRKSYQLSHRYPTLQRYIFILEQSGLITYLEARMSYRISFLYGILIGQKWQ